jgi:hypothetical protein
MGRYLVDEHKIVGDAGRRRLHVAGLNAATNLVIGRVRGRLGEC